MTWYNGDGAPAKDQGGIPSAKPQNVGTGGGASSTGLLKAWNGEDAGQSRGDCNFLDPEPPASDEPSGPPSVRDQVLAIARSAQGRMPLIQKSEPKAAGSDDDVPPEDAIDVDEPMVKSGASNGQLSPRSQAVLNALLEKAGGSKEKLQALAADLLQKSGKAGYGAGNLQHDQEVKDDSPEDALQKAVGESYGKVLAPVAAHLRALYQLHQWMHWRTNGAQFYADHELFARMYEAVSGEMDGFAEKVIGLANNPDAVLPSDNVAAAAALLKRFGLSPEGALAAEREFIDLLKQSRGKLGDLLTDGLDNMLQGMADVHEGHVYLLQQRTENVTKAVEGMTKEEPEEEEEPEEDPNAPDAAEQEEIDAQKEGGFDDDGEDSEKSIDAWLHKATVAHKYIKRLGPFFDKHGHKYYQYIYPEDLAKQKKKAKAPEKGKKKPKKTEGSEAALQNFLAFMFEPGKSFEIDLKGKKQTRTIVEAHDDATVTIEIESKKGKKQKRMPVDSLVPYMMGEPLSAEEETVLNIPNQSGPFDATHFSDPGFLASISGGPGGDSDVGSLPQSGEGWDELSIIEQVALSSANVGPLPAGSTWKPPAKGDALQEHGDLLPVITVELPENLKVFPGKIPGKEEIKMLYQHQAEGVERCLSAWEESDGFMLMDDAGLGKTNIALGAIAARGGKRNLVVVPTAGKQGLITQWQESGLLYNLDIKGPKEFEAGEEGTFVIGYNDIFEKVTVKNPITGEEVETSQIKENLAGDWDTIAFDESHTMQNPGRATSERGVELQTQAKKVLYMSATPYTNITNMHYLTKMGEFGDWHEFKEWAKKAGATVKGENVYQSTTGLKNMAAIAATFHVDGKALKRTATLDGMVNDFNVMQQGELTPEAHETFAAIHDITERVAKSGLVMKPFVRALYTNWSRQYWETLKIPKAIEMGKAALDEGKQVALFTSFKKPKKDPETGKPMKHAHIQAFWRMIERKGNKVEQKHGPAAAAPIYMMAKAIKEEINALPDPMHTTTSLVEAFGGESQVSQIHGDTNRKPGDEMLKYQNGENKVVVATMARGGTGISLHDTKGNAPRVQINLSLPWSGREFNQVAGRSQRLGSKSSAVQTWIVGDDPNEQKNAAKVSARLKTLGALTQGDPLQTLAAGDLAAWDSLFTQAETEDDVDSLIDDIMQAADDYDDDPAGTLASQMHEAKEVQQYFKEFAEQRKAGKDVLEELFKDNVEKGMKKAFLEARRSAEQIKLLAKGADKSVLHVDFDPNHGKFFMQGQMVDQKMKQALSTKGVGGVWNKFQQRLEFDVEDFPKAAVKLNVHQQIIDMTKVAKIPLPEHLIQAELQKGIKLDTYKSAVSALGTKNVITKPFGAPKNKQLMLDGSTKKYKSIIEQHGGKWSTSINLHGLYWVLPLDSLVPVAEAITGQEVKKSFLDVDYSGEDGILGAWLQKAVAHGGPANAGLGMETEKSMEQGDLQKAQYTRREGTPGHYKYFYSNPHGGPGHTGTTYHVEGNEKKGYAVRYETHGSLPPSPSGSRGRGYFDDRKGQSREIPPSVDVSSVKPGEHITEHRGEKYDGYEKLHNRGDKLPDHLKEEPFNVDDGTGRAKHDVWEAHDGSGIADNDRVKEEMRHPVRLEHHGKKNLHTSEEHALQTIAGHAAKLHGTGAKKSMQQFNLFDGFLDGDDLAKATYTRRTGTPGHYRYTYADSPSGHELGAGKRIGSGGNKKVTAHGTYTTHGNRKEGYSVHYQQHTPGPGEPIIPGGEYVHPPKKDSAFGHRADTVTHYTQEGHDQNASHKNAKSVESAMVSHHIEKLRDMKSRESGNDTANSMDPPGPSKQRVPAITEKSMKHAEMFGGFLEKAEGSRGGVIIGHTNSGKPIYQDHNHESHGKFHANDHFNAADQHIEAARKIASVRRAQKKDGLDPAIHGGRNSQRAAKQRDADYRQHKIAAAHHMEAGNMKQHGTTKKSMSGGMATAEPPKQMPTSWCSCNGGQVGGVGMTSGAQAPGSVPGASCSACGKPVKLSADDANVEGQMRDHKKPIEKTAKSLAALIDNAPGDGRVERQYVVRELTRGDDDVSLGIGVPSAPIQKSEPEPDDFNAWTSGGGLNSAYINTDREDRIIEKSFERGTGLPAYQVPTANVQGQLHKSMECSVCKSDTPVIFADCQACGSPLVDTPMTGGSGGNVRMDRSLTKSLFPTDDDDVKFGE